MSTHRNQRVIVGISGGVDSSVSAYLLKALGYEVEGLFMKNWDEDDGTEYCTALSDLEDAQKVCDKLGIKLHTASFSAEYWDRVFEHFLDEYRAGRTPNPDILCNKEIKFKAFLDYAQALGGNLIATGHYAQFSRFGEHTYLMKGADPSKEQSYFLHAVPGQALARTLFPVGGLLKKEVRRIAREQDLVTHDKKDSTGICFIGERKFSDFLKTYLPAQPGKIVTDKGEEIGRHQGLMYHTIGQRQGLGIGGLKGYDDAPWYVVEKDLDNNELVVAQGGDHPRLFSAGLTASKLDWINGLPAKSSFSCYAKTRYRQPDQLCRVDVRDGGVKVTFDKPQRAVTPGQSVVFYDGARCLGGGVIESVFK
ncbi:MULTISPECIES: tRNA 2-thiouridine(34) synthase MnmA [unclassified Hahella]|uniref:tRNA 2-thiouridine(34) synthase MnmA n=1 Tax=unclassified Hahella TaxID=2624107 RepID=UPI001C1EA8E5|nr:MULTISPECIES: tRNA 2-thiouridine(34) synthase MnmA [unclassified Hahella]MBU6950736.1 tRNA 2-thiouridine(34) synthase MnmA [Hahella sp. HN01]MDG9667372.1 tRNA 2-thiouridine(34) synthase MnmA [Hahella sp. CR1]